MDVKITKILQKVGLNGPEIKIYLTGLEVGTALASYLGKKSGISRQHVYDILKSLEEKGLVNTSGSSYNKRFTMEEPARIKNLLGRKKRSIENLEKQIDLLDIELKSMNYADHTAPKISFYDDLEGVKNMLEKSLDCNDKEILSIAPIKDFLSFLGEDFIKHFLNNRVKKNISARTLRVQSKELPDEWLKLGQKHKITVRYLPKDVNISSTFFIYDDIVSITSSRKENFGITLKSEELAQSMKGIFEALWMKAEEYDSKIRKENNKKLEE